MPHQESVHEPIYQDGLALLSELHSCNKTKICLRIWNAWPLHVTHNKALNLHVNRVACRRGIPKMCQKWFQRFLKLKGRNRERETAIPWSHSEGENEKKHYSNKLTNEKRKRVLYRSTVLNMTVCHWGGIHLMRHSAAAIYWSPPLVLTKLVRGKKKQRYLSISIRRVTLGSTWNALPQRCMKDIFTMHLQGPQQFTWTFTRPRDRVIIHANTIWFSVPGCSAHVYLVCFCLSVCSAINATGPQG